VSDRLPSLAADEVIHILKKADFSAAFSEHCRGGTAQCAALIAPYGLNPIL